MRTDVILAVAGLVVGASIFLLSYGAPRRIRHWIGVRRTHRRVRRIAHRTSAIWLTENGPSTEGPTATPRGVCHICQVGRHTLRDTYSGVKCCDHCGAPADQVPGGTPRDGVRASDEHLAGTCGCRSIGRPEIDARERERAYI